MADLIYLPLGMVGRVGPSNNVLDGEIFQRAGGMGWHNIMYGENAASATQNGLTD